MSSEANKALNGSVFYDRTPLNVQSAVDIVNGTRNLIYSAYARHSAGFYDWRHIIMGGATTGTTLS